jgi:anti-sigma B factor antagonist
MDVKKTVSDSVLTLSVSGKLSATTADSFGEAVEEAVGETAQLVFDFAEVTYLASSGLRILISAQKAIDAKDGNMTILNANEDLREVFEITGLDEIFDIR